MIVVQTNRLTQILGLLIIALTPAMALALGGSHLFWPGVWGLSLVPIALALELGLWLAMLAGGRHVRSVTPVLVVGLALMGVRAAACVPGALTVWGLQGDLVAQRSLQALCGDFWVGSPAVIALQLLVLALVAPAALHAHAPGFLSQSALNRLTRWSTITPAAPPPEPAPQPPKAEPAPPAAADGPTAAHAQPFIYSYSDLERYMDKVIGLEGYVILNREGLVIWGRSPWEIETEDLAGLLSRWLLAAGPLVSPSVDSPQGAVLHSGDHWITAVPLPEGAVLHLILTDRIDGREVMETTARVAGAVASLFAYRHGGNEAEPAANKAPVFAPA